MFLKIDTVVFEPTFIESKTKENVFEQRKNMARKRAISEMGIDKVERINKSHRTQIKLR